jgi:hypothetical protein
MASTTKTTPAAHTIKKFDILSIAKFFAVIGFVWGFLAGLILLASYVQGYMTNGDVSILQSGLIGFGQMIVYGVIGGIIGGAIIAFMYNMVLGAKHGIRMELD